MHGTSPLFVAIEVFTLPIVGMFVLTLSKITTGALAQLTERWFLGVLIAVTLITCRTVIKADPCWFAHTATLGLMIIGSLLLPNRQSLASR